MELIALFFVVFVGAGLVWAGLVAVADVSELPEGNPWLEDRGLAHRAARTSGIRLNRAPNQATRRARFARLDQALGKRALCYADARMRGLAVMHDLDTSGRHVVRHFGG